MLRRILPGYRENCKSEVGGIGTMKQVTCPLDGKPCGPDCPDRYRDRPEGGCPLTTAREAGATIVNFGGGSIGMLFMPD